MSKYIDALIQILAYTAYTKMYGIKDRPIGKIEIHLSDKDNDWNRLAIATKTLIDDLSDITIKENQALKITNKNNDWNQLAIDLGAKNKQPAQFPNK